jgi:hypothetical protein
MVKIFIVFFLFNTTVSESYIGIFFLKRITFTSKDSFPQFTDSLKISGRVISALDGKPIPGASVLFTKNKGMHTNEEGEFTITRIKKGTHRIKIRFLDFCAKDSLITVDKNINNIIITLRPQHLGKRSINSVKDKAR